MIFTDWMANLDHYFNWYKFTEENRFQFTKMRLQGHLEFIRHR